MDWTLYWFMFPAAALVASAAMLSGIGGSALFIPIFVILFPVLGPEYPLSTAAAIGAALITQLFGFSSGFVGYYRKRLIDFRSAVPFYSVSIPVAVAGALTLALLQQHEAFLKAGYGLLMLALCPIILRRPPPGQASRADADSAAQPVRTIVARDGRRYSYRAPRLGALGIGITGLGAFLTGLLGVGIGEVVVPQLVKRGRVPVAIAAATSVFVVIVTVAAASFTQATSLIAAAGPGAIPWNLVCYTAPGVIIGGQIGPWLQGRIAQRTVERTIAVLCAAIGLSMLWIVFR